MLSNPTLATSAAAHNGPPSALQTRQRLHRRQRSTPTAYEMKVPSNLAHASAVAMQVQPLQPHQQQSQSQQLQQLQRQQPARGLGHRRGLSLDTRRQQLQQRQQRQQQIQHMQHQHQQFMAAAGIAPGAANTTNNTNNDNSNTVSNTATNQGLTTTTQQHVLRETQQQRSIRPGAFAKLSSEEDYLLSPLGTPTNMMTTRSSQQFDGGKGAAAAAAGGGGVGGGGTVAARGAAFEYYNGNNAAAVMMRKTLSGGGLPMQQQQQQQHQDFQLFDSPDGISASNPYMSFQDPSMTTSAASPQGWASEDDTSSTRRTVRRVSNGIMDRVSKFESLLMDEMSRPSTPQHQNDNVYFPPTPTETPQERMAKHGQARMDRFSVDYDGSMEETIKPARNGGRQSNRNSGIFDDLRQQAEAAAAASVSGISTMTTPPPRSQLMHMPLTPADFMNMSNVNAEFIKIQNANYANLAVPADIQHLSPPLSQHPTPATAQGVFETTTATVGVMEPHSASPFDTKPSFWPPPEYDMTPSPYGTGMGIDADADADVANQHCGRAVSPPHSESASTPSPLRRSGHRRNESLASIVSAASISSINIEETRTETGVTLDDIAVYIDGPNPADGKWRCLYEGCDKRFGRKENIKSHVQTHLNDRQYQCPHCQKCFVRQHDLKRHAKIHTGVKPYPCECGNSFARHDALTRHRQRGMCIGAFDGAVRKVGKRGRPRKTRPNLELRRDKSSRTRNRNKAASSGRGAYDAGNGAGLPSSPEASSHSGFSDSSAANSPGTDDSDNPFDDEPFDDNMDDDLLGMDFGATGGGRESENNGNNNSSSGSNGHGGNGNNSGSSGGSGSNSHGGHSAAHNSMNPSSLSMSSAPMPGTLSSADMIKIMPVSPSEHSAAFAASPSTMSHYSYTSHTSHVSRASLPGCSNSQETDMDGADGSDEFLPSGHPASPAKSVASHYTQHPNTPPELSASSSPPQSSSTQFFDLDPNSSCTEEDSIGLSAPLTSTGCGGPLGMDVSGGGLSAGSLDAADLMLMKAFSNEDVLVQLDNSGLSMLNTSKFDDEYGMFTNSDDVFFGN